MLQINSPGAPGALLTFYVFCIQLCQYLDQLIADFQIALLNLTKKSRLLMKNMMDTSERLESFTGRIAQDGFFDFLNRSEVGALSALNDLPASPFMRQAKRQAETLDIRWSSNLFVSDCGYIIFTQKHMFIHEHALLGNSARYPNMQSLRHNRSWFKVSLDKIVVTDGSTIKLEDDEKVIQMVRQPLNQNNIIYFCTNKNKKYCLRIRRNKPLCAPLNDFPGQVYGGAIRTKLNLFNAPSFEQSPVFLTDDNILLVSSDLFSNLQNPTQIDTRLLNANETIKKLCIMGEHRAFYTSNNRVIRLDHQPDGSFTCALLFTSPEAIQDMELTATTLYLKTGQHLYEYNNGPLEKIDAQLNEGESVIKITTNKERVILITDAGRALSKGLNPHESRWDVQPYKVYTAKALEDSVIYHTHQGIIVTGKDIFFDSLVSKITKTLPIMGFLCLNLMKAYYVLEVFIYLLTYIAMNPLMIPLAIFLGFVVYEAVNLMVEKEKLIDNRSVKESAFLIIFILNRILSIFLPLWVFAPFLLIEIVMFFGVLSLYASDDFLFVRSISKLWAPVPDEIRQRLLIDEDIEDEQNARPLLVN